MISAFSILAPWLATLFCVGGAHGAFWGYEGAREAWLADIWEYDLPAFSAEAYAEGVEALLGDFEATTGRTLVPGEFRRAGLKIYTQSGPGIATPRELTVAVIEALEARGFRPQELFILDVNRRHLRAAGYLPPLSARNESDTFHGVPVYALDEGQLYDERWFYDNPLPRATISTTLLDAPELRAPAASEESRKSYLAGPLADGVDFWINLPVVTDHRAMGINGAIANATLWSVSNRDRFFASPANAPVAMAEIAAIPELLANWAVTILTLEEYQVIAGPRYNAHYAYEEPLLWLSANPVLLDALMLERMNAARRERRLPVLGSERGLPVLKFAEQVGVGPGDPRLARWHEVN